jgi:hypothetical protein
MARPDLKVRADALRAEAAVARRQLDETYESSRAELRRQLMQSTRDAETAHYGAERAADHAKGSRIEEDNLRSLADHEEQKVANHERDGKVDKAEDSREWVAMRRREADATSEEARQLDIEAARLREEEAGHQRRLAELDDEVQDLYSRHETADTNLDNLENQTRLYDEAWRKFAAAEATDNIPERAQLELEAEKALRDAEAIEVDRTAIRAFVPDLPEVTPGLPSTPTASLELGEEATAQVNAAGDELGLDLLAVDGSADASEAAVDADVAADEPFTVEAPAADDLASIETPPAAMEAFEPQADDTGFAMADSFGVDAPAESFESTGDTFDS